MAILVNYMYNILMIKGYTWKQVEGLTPQILAAFEQMNVVATETRKITIPYWILDYSYKNRCQYRVLNPNRPWQDRQDRKMHHADVSSFSR